MNRTNYMKHSRQGNIIKFLLVAGLFILSINLHADVPRGPRPPVDIENLNDDAWIPGKLLIRFAAQTHFPSLIAAKSGESFVTTGNTGLDSLNQKFGVTRFRSILHGYYNTSAKAAGFAERHAQWGFHLWYELQLHDETDIRSAVEQFKNLKGVDYAEPVFRVELVYNSLNEETGNNTRIRSSEKSLIPWYPNDLLFGAHWPLHNTGQSGGIPGRDIGMPYAWAMEKGHPEVIVAIIDGGVDYEHEDLAGNMWEGIGFNFSINSPIIEPDPQSHGTHVAGTVAALTNNAIGVSGIAGGSGNNDGVRIMSCQIFNTDYTADGIPQAFLFAADNGAAIAQNSWVFSTPGTYNQLIADAIDYFNTHGGGDVMQGGISFFGAGNNNSGAMYFPPSYEHTFAVAATSHNDSRAGYSNFQHYIDISAPGGSFVTGQEGGILSTVNNNEYQFKQGTSMACPHVSGVAALIISMAHRNQEQITPHEVKELLKMNATDIYSGFNLNYYNQLGAGRLDAFRALTDFSNRMNGLYNPGFFATETISTEEIVLSWESSADNPQVLLTASLSPANGSPDQGTEYQPGSMIDGLGTVIYKGTLNNFVHSGLEPATLYYYAIFTVGTDDTYSTGIRTRALTGCETFQIPFAEDFSEGLVPAPCWSTFDLSGDGISWRAFGDFSTNRYVAVSESSIENTGIAPDNWLISPLIHITSGSMVLGFDVRAQDVFDWDEQFSVLVSETSSHDPESFVEVFTGTTPSNQWERIMVNISGYSGKDVHIAIRHWGESSVFLLMLKDFFLDQAPLGDVLPDNEITIQDVVWLINYLEGNTPEGFAFDLADINGDGEIDQADLEALIDILMQEEQKTFGQ